MIYKYPDKNYASVLIISGGVVIFPSREGEKLLPVIAEKMKKLEWRDVKLVEMEETEHGKGYILESVLPLTWKAKAKSFSKEDVHAWRMLVIDALKSMGIHCELGIPPD